MEFLNEVIRMIKMILLYLLEIGISILSWYFPNLIFHKNLSTLTCCRTYIYLLLVFSCSIFMFFKCHGEMLVWQVENLQKHVKANELPKKIELVVVSPLLRYLLQFWVLPNHIYFSLCYLTSFSVSYKNCVSELGI